MRVLVLVFVLGCTASRKPPASPQPVPVSDAKEQDTKPAVVDDHSSDWIRHVVEPPGTRTR
jgi:hypothetical protein